MSERNISTAPAFGAALQKSSARVNQNSHSQPAREGGEFIHKGGEGRAGWIIRRCEYWCVEGDTSGAGPGLWRCILPEDRAWPSRAGIQSVAQALKADPVASGCWFPGPGQGWLSPLPDAGSRPSQERLVSIPRERLSDGMSGKPGCRFIYTQPRGRARARV